MTNRKRNTPKTAFEMQRAMQQAPQSYRQLAAISQLNKPAVEHWVRSLRAQELAHVAGWGPDKRGRLFVPLFVWGPGRDAPRPGPLRTDAERMRDLRAARKGLT